MPAPFVKNFIVSSLDEIPPLLSRYVWVLSGVPILPTGRLVYPGKKTHCGNSVALWSASTSERVSPPTVYF